jgi:hypothetical protein
MNYYGMKYLINNHFIHINQTEPILDEVIHYVYV